MHVRKFVWFFFYWRGINCDGVQTLWKVFRLFPKAGLAIITGQWVFTTIFLTFRENDSKSRVGYFRNQEVKDISQERKKQNINIREQTDRLMMVDCPVRKRDIRELLLLIQSIHCYITSQLSTAGILNIYSSSTCWSKQYKITQYKYIFYNENYRGRKAGQYGIRVACTVCICNTCSYCSNCYYK